MRIREILPAVCGTAALTIALISPAAAEVTVKPFGRVHFDIVAADDDVTELGSGTEFRRARIGFEGTITDDWAYESEFDLADGEAAVKDVYVSYMGWAGGNFLIGQFKPGFSPMEPGSWRRDSAPWTLNDAGFAGGEQENVTLGLNYYHSPNLRFMLNYVMASADPSSTGIEEEPKLIQARAQVDFK